MPRFSTGFSGKESWVTCPTQPYGMGSTCGRIEPAYSKNGQLREKRLLYDSNERIVCQKYLAHTLVKIVAPPGLNLLGQSMGITDIRNSLTLPVTDCLPDTSGPIEHEKESA